ncbi:MAG: RdgB/HAM1 family non-canonical purine NTP pyrophosphatase [Kyrpidia sp.]|nr:RdgB/HAM1 family non-canonical purine NTP pyrophosphatase [Kyrpidia sp.]
MDIVLATKNRGKAKEFDELLRPLGWRVSTLDSFARYEPPPENGATFCDNASSKAKAAAEALGLPALADDSGLEVEALGGRPGVYSARFAGPEATDEENNRLLLAELAHSGIPGPWKARFVCCLALAWPNDHVRTFLGEVRGWIVDRPRGKEGFGYDPLFWCPELGRTFGEASPAEKNRVSHRRKAMEALARDLGARGRGAGEATPRS